MEEERVLPEEPNSPKERDQPENQRINDEASPAWSVQSNQQNQEIESGGVKRENDENSYVKENDSGKREPEGERIGAMIRSYSQDEIEDRRE